MVHVLYGPDEFTLRQELQKIKASLGDRESLALNTAVLEGRRLTPAQAIEACNVIPFLANWRLVIVEGLLERFDPAPGKGPQSAGKPASGQKRTKGGGKHAPVDDWKALVDYLPVMPPGTVLVFIDGKLAKGNPLLHMLARAAATHQFPPLESAALQAWIRARAAERAADISPGAVRRLIEIAGDNLFVLTGEIEKLSLYTRGRRIQEADVQQVTSFAREASIFTLVDAIADKRLPVAMRLLHQMLTEGAEPVYLLTMMARQVRLMIQVKDLRRRPGLKPEQMRAYLGVSPNFFLDGLDRMSAGHSAARLVAIHEKVLDADLSIKTGRWPDELALDLLVAEVCS